MLLVTYCSVTLVYWSYDVIILITLSAILREVFFTHLHVKKKKNTGLPPPLAPARNVCLLRSPSTFLHCRVHTLQSSSNTRGWNPIPPPHPNSSCLSNSFNSAGLMFQKTCSRSMPWWHAWRFSSPFSSFLSKLPRSWGQTQNYWNHEWRSVAVAFFKSNPVCRIPLFHKNDEKKIVLKKGL